MTTILLLALAAPTAKPVEWFEFIGFSKDERIAAYRHDVQMMRSDGTVDQYSLIHTVDVNSGFEVAAFKATAIERVNIETAKPLRVARAELLDDNPAFRDAYPNKRWMQLKRRSGFSRRMVTVGNEAMPVAFDDDTKGNSADNTDGHYLASTSGPLGFRVVVRDASGDESELGHYRQAGGKDVSIIARVQAFTSKSKKAVALCTIFMVNDGEMARTLPAIKVVRSERKLATTPMAKAKRKSNVAQRTTEVASRTSKQEKKALKSLDNLYGWYVGANPL